MATRQHSGDRSPTGSSLSMEQPGSITSPVSSAFVLAVPAPAHLRSTVQLSMPDGGTAPVLTTHWTTTHGPVIRTMPAAHPARLKPHVPDPVASTLSGPASTPPLPSRPTRNPGPDAAIGTATDDAPLATRQRRSGPRPEPAPDARNVPRVLPAVVHDVVTGTRRSSESGSGYTATTGPANGLYDPSATLSVGLSHPLFESPPTSQDTDADADADTLTSSGASPDDSSGPAFDLPADSDSVSSPPDEPASQPRDARAVAGPATDGPSTDSPSTETLTTETPPTETRSTYTRSTDPRSERGERIQRLENELDWVGRRLALLSSRMFDELLQRAQTEWQVSWNETDARLVHLNNLGRLHGSAATVWQHHAVCTRRTELLARQRDMRADVWRAHERELVRVRMDAQTQMWMRVRMEREMDEQTGRQMARERSSRTGT